MKRHIAWILAVGLVMWGALPSWLTADENAQMAVQELCPVMEENPIDPSIYIDYQGKRVYFCCMLCKATFEKEPETYLAKLPQLSVDPEAPDAEPAHDHLVDHGAPDEPSRLLTFMGKFHPVAIHIPIALVLVAALAELLAMMTRNGTFEKVSRFNINVAVLGAAVSVGLGLLAGMSADFPGDYARPFWLHKWIGITMAVFIAVAAVLSELACRRGGSRCRWGYRAVLLLCVALVGAAGYFGGQLVYGLNHYAW